ncbi:MAG: ABC transporter, permease protein 2 (cluster 1, maltose/g3p/polyamine/iron), partial [uncultured Rubrobacteraceae bacterium]
AAPHEAGAVLPDGGARRPYGLPTALDALRRLQGPRRGQQREPHPRGPDPGQLSVRLHGGAVLALHAQQPLRGGDGDPRGAVVPFDGGLRPREAPFPWARPALLRHLLHAPCSFARDPGPALHSGQGAGDAGQLRGPDNPRDLQCLRHISPQAVLPGDAEGTRGRGVRGRLRVLGCVLARDTPPEPAHTRGPGGLLLPGELEQLPVAADHNPGSGPVDDPGGHSELPNAVRRGLELHHGRRHRGSDTDDGALFRLPAPARRVHKDIGLQV